MKRTSELSHMLILLLFLTMIIATPFSYASILNTEYLRTSNSESLKASNLTDLKTFIVTELTNRNPSFSVTYTGPTAGIKDNLDTIILEELPLENPYIYHSLDEYKYEYNGFKNNITIDFEMRYLTNQSQEAFVGLEVTRILNEITHPYMSPFEKIKAVNDYIVLNTIYSEDSINSPHSPFTILKEARGVCQAYALLGYKMLEQLGMEVMYVVGEAGEPHAWNLIQLEGEWYHLDMTWNDPVPDTIGNVSYKYFLVSDDYLSKTHTWEKNNYPYANSNKYLYLKSVSNSVTFNNTIYYSNESDNNRLYKMNINGSNKLKLTNDRAYFISLAGDWIYYSNYSNSGYLYKITLNGLNKQRINNNHTIDIYEKDGWIHYTIKNSGAKQKLYVGSKKSFEHVNFLSLPTKFYHPLNKGFTIKFNLKIDKNTLITSNIFVASDKNGHYPISGVTLSLDHSNQKNVILHPPALGWNKDHTYYLFITDKIASTTDINLSRTMRFRFMTPDNRIN